MNSMFSWIGRRYGVIEVMYFPMLQIPKHLRMYKIWTPKYGPRTYIQYRHHGILCHDVNQGILI